MTGINGQGGFDITARAQDLLTRIGEGLAEAADRLGLDEAKSGLERLLGTPSPLDGIGGGESTGAAARPPASSPEPTTYRVRSGDTLSGIAARHGTSVAALVRANGIADPDRIGVGQRLRLPAGGALSAPGAAAVREPTASNGAAATGGAASTGGLSQAGMDFIYAHEAQAGVSDRLHWPRGASGVTLGPGYDMKNRSAAEITRDLTAVGVDPAAAARAARGAGLTGGAARDFAAANRGLIDLSPAQERQLLAQTVKSYADHVRAKITVPVTQNQFDAMVSFAYNIGTPGFDGSSALRKLNAGDAAGAAEAMKLWNKSDGRVNQGLVNRRNDEVALFNAAGAPMRNDPATGAAAPAGRSEQASAPARSPAALAGEIERNGDAQAKADLAAGRKVVLALRTETSAKANGGRGVYDDTVAVVWKDANGTYRAETFKGNTEPSGQYAFDGPKASRGSSTDLNGDGRNDLGRLREGTIRYQRSEGTFLGNTFFRAMRTQVAERDVNGDGRFDARDGARVDRSGAGTSMLIHQGGTNNTWSAGCQTMPKSDFNQFVAVLGGQRAFSYVLVDAR